MEKEFVNKYRLKSLEEKIIRLSNGNYRTILSLNNNRKIRKVRDVLYYFDDLYKGFSAWHIVVYYQDVQTSSYILHYQDGLYFGSDSINITFDEYQIYIDYDEQTSNLLDKLLVEAEK